MATAAPAAGALVAAVCAAAALGCGQEAPQDLSYVEIELDRASGGPGDVRLVIDSPVAPSNTLCVKLVPEGAGAPASLDLYRKFGADPKPRVTLTVTPYAALDNDSVTQDGSQFNCPGTFPSPFAPKQVLTFDFCAEKAVKVTVNAGAKCSGCDPATEVCGAGLSTDGSPCGPTECCSNAISDACALVQVPTTMTMAPQ